ncbi:MAG TPA: TcpE family conjugal transfer membrane protein [Streptosporangiaceae bacterium]|nr:TcpE family conjugal transfer membrane protein [Streptosporangiaceae bacterium]
MDLPTYTNIWRIEKRLYKLYDLRLPIPLPLVQIGVFLGVFVPWIVLLQLVGIPFGGGWILPLYLVPPAVLTWLGTRPVIEGKRLTELVQSQSRYLGEPRTWCRLTPISEPREVVVVAKVWRRLGTGTARSVSPTFAEAIAARDVMAAGATAVVHPQAMDAQAVQAYGGVPVIGRPYVPTLDASAYDVPAYDAPAYDAPAYDAREYDAPAYDAREYDASAYDAREYEARVHGRDSIDAESYVAALIGPEPYQPQITPDPTAPLVPRTREPEMSELEPLGQVPVVAAESPPDTPRLELRPQVPAEGFAGEAAAEDATEEAEEAEPQGSGKRALASGVRRPGAAAEFWKAIAPETSQPAATTRDDIPRAGTGPVASTTRPDIPMVPGAFGAGGQPHTPGRHERPAAAETPVPERAAQAPVPTSAADPVVPPPVLPPSGRSWPVTLPPALREGNADALIWPPQEQSRRPGPDAVRPQAPAAEHGIEPAAIEPAATEPARTEPTYAPIEEASEPVPPPRQQPRERKTWPPPMPTAPGTSRSAIPPRPQGTPVKPPPPSPVPDQPRPAEVFDGEAPARRRQAEAPVREVRSGPVSPVARRPLMPPAPPPSQPAVITPPDVDLEDGSGGLRRLMQAVGGGHGQLDSEYEERLQRPFQGTRHIVVLGCTGGAGQTVSALMLGHTFAQYCGEPIVAVDVNPGPGALARRTRSENGESLTGLIARADQVNSLAAMRRYTVQTKSGLDVVAAGRSPLNALDDRDYALAIRTLDRFYSVTLLDAAAAVVARVLPHADQVVLVAPASADAPRAVSMTFEWLDGHGYGELRARAVTVINGVSRRSMEDVEQAEAVARGRCRALVRIPWDDHLSLDRSPRNELKSLRAPTRRAYLALAGVVAGGFTTVPERYTETEQEVGR